MKPSPPPTPFGKIVFHEIGLSQKGGTVEVSQSFEIISNMACLVSNLRVLTCAHMHEYVSAHTGSRGDGNNLFWRCRVSYC